MSRISPILLGMSLAIAGGSVAAAQDAPAPPPKVIQIVRESFKLGKSGAAHDRSAANFVSIATRAKQQGHFIALDAMSGKPRALYVTGYSSFEAWEKDSKLIDGNAALAAEMDHAIVTEGEFAEDVQSEVFTLNEDWSFHPDPDLAHMRYADISIFHIRAGHHKEFNDCVKMVKEANEKAGSNAHWVTYEMAYGGEGNTVIALSHRKSLSEIDMDMAEGKKFAEAMGGEDGMQKLDEVCGLGSESSRTELFSVNPKQSYVPDSMVKADPDFWKPKAKAESAAKPAAPKPNPAAAAKPGGR
jgi:hypothetical protein